MHINTVEVAGWELGGVNFLTDYKNLKFLN